MTHTRDWPGARVAFGVPLTSQVHPGLETLPYAARRAVFPADLVDDAVVPAGAQVVVLTWVERRRRGLFILAEMGGGGLVLGWGIWEEGGKAAAVF